MTLPIIVIPFEWVGMDLLEMSAWDQEYILVIKAIPLRKAISKAITNERGLLFG